MKTLARNRHHGGPLLVLFLVLLAVGGQLVHHPLATAIAGTVVAAASGLLAWRLINRRDRATQRRTAAGFQRMNPSQFEHALADLCRRDGCTSVRVVGGKGDLAADVLATLPSTWWRRALRLGQQRILIQAKHYQLGNPVRSPALQAVNGTYRDVHGAHLAAVVTTSSFTREAREFGNQVGMRLFDEHALAAWASQTGPAPWQS